MISIILYLFHRVCSKVRYSLSKREYIIKRFNHPMERKQNCEECGAVIRLFPSQLFQGVGK